MVLVEFVFSTLSVVLLSSVLMLAQCCKKKKPKAIPQQLPQDPNIMPPPTQLQRKSPAKGKKVKRPPPNLREDQPRAQGIGVGKDYQTLGNLDKNIFVKGQKQKENKAKKTPVPEQPKAPAGVEEVPQKEGLAAGGDYQTMADIYQNVFKGDNAGAQPSPAPAAAPSPDGPGAGSKNEAAPEEGIGQGADYQTWNNLDQNVFANNKKDGGSKSSADKKSAAGSGSQKEAPPKEGIGAGADYQTWNSMDKDVFLKGKSDDKKSDAGKASEASKQEEAPRAGVGQGQDYQTWNALDKDVFVKK